MQCCGSMTFWGGSGSGSADPCLWLMESQNSRNQGFSYYFCMMIEGSGSIPLTSRSGSRRPKNMWIRWIRIRNTAFVGHFCPPGSGSTEGTDPIESGSITDPDTAADPQPWKKLCACYRSAWTGYIMRIRIRIRIHNTAFDSVRFWLLLFPFKPACLCVQLYRISANRSVNMLSEVFDSEIQSQASRSGKEKPSYGSYSIHQFSVGTINIFSLLMRKAPLFQAGSQEGLQDQEAVQPDQGRWRLPVRHQEAPAPQGGELFLTSIKIFLQKGAGRGVGTVIPFCARIPTIRLKR